MYEGATLDTQILIGRMLKVLRCCEQSSNKTQQQYIYSYAQRGLTIYDVRFVDKVFGGKFRHEDVLVQTALSKLAAQQKKSRPAISFPTNPY